MGSEFAELQKRPEKQQDPYAHRYAPKPQTKLVKPGKPPIRLAATYPEQRRVIDPENPGQYKIEGWTPEAQARYDDNPELAWLKDPNGKPPTPQEAVLMRKAKKRQQLEPASSIPVKSEPMQVVPLAAVKPEVLSSPPPGSSPKTLFPVANAASETAPFSVQLGVVATPLLMAGAIPFPSRGLSMPPLPALPQILPGAMKAVAPIFKGVGSFVGGVVLEGVLAEPLNNEEAEFLRQRNQQHNAAPAVSTPAQTAPAQPSTLTAPLPMEPSYQVPNGLAQQRQQQQIEQQQQQWKQEQQQQQAVFEAQQAAQTKLTAKQEKLNRLSAGFVTNETQVESFEKQLTPSQKGALTKEVKARYQTLTGLAQQADNPFEKYEVAEIQQKLRQQVLYERFVPVREIYHFGNKFLNGYTPQKMKAVRGYFDQVFEGNYAKSIPADKRAAILKSADARYTEETGKKPNREDALWKTLRNVEASEKFPDLWTQFRQDLSKANNGVMATVVGSKDPNLGSNALNRPDRTQPLKIPDHTGHRPEQVDTGSKPFDLDSAPKVPNDTAHRDQEKPDVTNVFAAKEGEIPGVDIPFRKVNPKYPANPDVLDKVRVLQERIKNPRNEGLDCSEIAQDLLNAAKGKGQIINVLPPKGKDLTLYELGRKDDGFLYHQVYTDGRYVYDPRLSSEPVPKGDWEIMIRSLNPESSFQSIKGEN
jgi:hypothetical protein